MVAPAGEVDEVDADDDSEVLGGATLVEWSSMVLSVVELVVLDSGDEVEDEPVVDSVLGDSVADDSAVDDPCAIDDATAATAAALGCADPST